ncbi:ribonuclease H-like domain-containing protein [Tanacetum coccineum]
MAGRLNMLDRDRRAHTRIALLMEREARMYQEAWGWSMNASDLAHTEVRALRTQVVAQQSEIAALSVEKKRYKPLINAKNLERLLDPHLVDAYDLEQLNDMLKPKSVEDVMRVGKMGCLGNGSITGNFALVQLERNFVQYINSLLQDSGTDFWGTRRFLAHTEKQVASHMDGSRNFSRGPSFDPLLTESMASDATGQHKFWQKGSDGNSWVPIPVTSPAETGTSTGTKMTVPSTAEEKTCKKNDVKARSLLLMALPNEHQLTLDQFVDAQSMFATIKARFGGNEATKKTQKALLKQQYENFSASSSESLDSIFNRLQRLVSRLAILGVVTPPEDLNVKFLRSLPSEWDTHVVVWMNKPDFDTMGLDDLYNNFKIVEQKVKKSAGASNDDKNLAFVTTSGASSTNNINTVNPEVSTATTKVNTASTEICTASFSDATVYAFLSTQPKGSQLVHEDLEQLHDDDLEEMDLKWNMALLSMRARKFYQRTGRKIIIDGSNTAGYDKSKVECFNCHKMGHFARECRAPRSKDNRNWNQGSSTKAVKIEDASEKAMCAIDGAGFDWSDMAEEEIQANMALMAFSDSEVTNDKSCSKSCLKNYEALKKQYDDLLVKLDDTGFKAATYKRGLATLEEQIIKYREHEVLVFEEIALLKRSVGHKEYQIGLLRDELEKVKQEKEGFEFKIAKFDKSIKDLEQLLADQITDKSKKGFGYNAVPSPHPLILNRLM